LFVRGRPQLQLMDLQPLAKLPLPAFDPAKDILVRTLGLSLCLSAQP
jgi:hypothetical protein